MVPVAERVAASSRNVALVGLLSSTATVSASSWVVSFVIGTLIVLLVSFAAKVSVVLGTAVKSVAAAVPPVVVA